MSKDPAFLFYPGDYLRDTQCLNPNCQVAYDRIMCEHMRNICITQQQLKFFTKRLNEEELEELLMVLSEKDGKYQIAWVAESIEKRRKYSESRRNNRKGKKNKTHDKDVLTYVNHMENENEIENINRSAGEILQEWLVYRKGIKKEVKNEKTLAALAKRFKNEPLLKVAWVVKHSIENQYQGLFWDQYDEKKHSKPKKNKGDEMDNVTF